MKLIQTTLSLLSMIAFAATISSCATNNAQIDESVAINAGFKTITPKTAEQKALLARLPINQLSPIRHDGKQYYVIPNLAKNQAYVGGPKQLKHYEKLQVGEEINDANLAATPLIDAGWGQWGGWNNIYATGWY